MLIQLKRRADRAATPVHYVCAAQRCECISYVTEIPSTDKRVSTDGRRFHRLGGQRRNTHTHAHPDGGARRWPGGGGWAGYRRLRCLRRLHRHCASSIECEIKYYAKHTVRVHGSGNHDDDSADTCSSTGRYLNITPGQNPPPPLPPELTEYWFVCLSSVCLCAVVSLIHFYVRSGYVFALCCHIHHIRKHVRTHVRPPARTHRFECFCLRQTIATAARDPRSLFARAHARSFAAKARQAPISHSGTFEYKNGGGGGRVEPGWCGRGWYPGIPCRSREDW